MAAASEAGRADRLGGAVWMAFGLAVLVGAWRMDRFESMGANLYSAPGLVPGIYGLLMIVLGAALALRSPRAADGPDDAGPLVNRRVALMLGLSLAYAAAAVGRLPFGASTAVFVAAFCWVFDDQQPSALRRAAMASAAGVLTAVVVVLVFERVFLVRLP